MTGTLTAHAVRQVAVRAQVDPRTVSRLIRGKPVRDSVAERIRRAMVELGFPSDTPREISTTADNSNGEGET